MTVLERATERENVRFISGAVEEHHMAHAAHYYHIPRQRPTWVDYVVDPVIWGMKKAMQRIDDGVSKAVFAIGVMVISAIIVGVGGMAVAAYFGQTEINHHLTSIDDHLKSIDTRLGAGNGGRSGP